jgi:hypothetical protein
VGELKRQQIARILHQNRVPMLDRAVKIAVDPGADRGDVAAFAVVGPVGERLCSGQARHHVVIDAHFHGLGQHAGLETKSHDEIGMVGQHAIDRGHRVADEAQAFEVRGLQAVKGILVVGGNGNASAIQ